MRLQPKSEKQIQEDRFPVLKPGRYHFEVVAAKEEVSKKGNPMIVIQLKILDVSFEVLTFLKDYLMESMAYKLRHAAYACSLGDHYEAGELHAESFIGKSGILELKIEKDKSGQYPDKNSVQDYIKDEQKIQGQAQVQRPAPKTDSWDDLPGEPPDWVK